MKKGNVEVSKNDSKETYWLCILQDAGAYSTNVSKQALLDLRDLLNEILKEEKSPQEVCQPTEVTTKKERNCCELFGKGQGLHDMSCHQPTHLEDKEQCASRECSNKEPHSSDIHIGSEEDTKKEGNRPGTKFLIDHDFTSHNGVPEFCSLCGTIKLETLLEPLTEPQKPTKRPSERIGEIQKELSKNIAKPKNDVEEALITVGTLARATTNYLNELNSQGKL